MMTDYSYVYRTATWKRVRLAVLKRERILVPDQRSEVFGNCHTSGSHHPHESRW